MVAKLYFHSVKSCFVYLFLEDLHSHHKDRDEVEDIRIYEKVKKCFILFLYKITMLSPHH